MNKYITNNDRRPALPDFYRVIYSDGNTGVEHFDGTTWQVEYSHPVDRWLEESTAQPSILSPEEWLDQAEPNKRFIWNWKGATKLLEAYGYYVATKVHRESRHRAAEIVDEYGPEMGQIQDRIMNIPLRDFYPGGKKTETNGQ